MLIETYYLSFSVICQGSELALLYEIFYYLLFLPNDKSSSWPQVPLSVHRFWAAHSPHAMVPLSSLAARTGKRKRTHKIISMDIGFEFSLCGYLASSGSMSRSGFCSPASLSRCHSASHRFRKCITSQCLPARENRFHPHQSRTRLPSYIWHKENIETGHYQLSIDGTNLPKASSTRSTTWNATYSTRTTRRTMVPVIDAAAMRSLPGRQHSTPSWA